MYPYPEMPGRILAHILWHESQALTEMSGISSCNTSINPEDRKDHHKKEAEQEAAQKACEKLKREKVPD